MTDIFSGLVEWVIDVIHSLGYLGIAFLIALENVFPPVPSELILPLSGFLVGQGRFSFVPVIVAATAGSVTGALFLYGLGRQLGDQRIRNLTKQYGRFLFISEEDLDKAQGWFDHHGSGAVLIGRLVPGVRSLISIPAGLVGMSLGQFILFTTIGSAAWNTLLISVGWFLGDQWAVVSEYLEILQYVILGIAVIVVIWFLWKRRREAAHEQS